MSAQNLEAFLPDEPQGCLGVKMAEEHRLAEPLPHSRWLFLRFDAEEEEAARGEPRPNLGQEFSVALARKMIEEIQRRDRLERLGRKVSSKASPQMTRALGTFSFARPTCLLERSTPIPECKRGGRCLTLDREWLSLTGRVLELHEAVGGAATRVRAAQARHTPGQQRRSPPRPPSGAHPSAQP
jgi:hypothetical protein